MNDDFNALLATLADVSEKCGRCVRRPCPLHRCHQILRNGQRCGSRIGPGREDFCHRHGCRVELFADPKMFCSEPVITLNCGPEEDYQSLCLAHATAKFPNIEKEYWGPGTRQEYVVSPGPDAFVMNDVGY